MKHYSKPQVELIGDLRALTAQNANVRITDVPEGTIVGEDEGLEAVIGSY